MAIFVWLVTNIISSIPASTASSTAYSIKGLSIIGSISFGIAFVAGRRYILDSDIFKYIKRVEEDSSGEIQLTDAIKLMLKDKAILGCKYEGVKFDCGSKKGFVAATLYKGLEDEAIKQEIEKFIGNP